MRLTRSHGGFTLIEMLVALALMGMIAVILITSLQIGGHTWQRVTHAAGNTDDIAQAQEALRLRLSTLYPENRSVAAVPRAFLSSNGSSLEFLSEAPRAAVGGIVRYRIAVSTSSGALQIASWSDQTAEPSGLKPELLLPGVASLEIRFWMKPEAATGRWVDRWESAQLPQLIRIDVGFASNDKRRWPPLYIEPRIDTPASCVFDVVSRRCRSGA